MSNQISKLIKCLLTLSLLASLSLSTAFAQSQLPAFPGAEGFGSTTPGGRFGKIYKVTHLKDTKDYSSPDYKGSLRECIQASGPRICVFTVGGTIKLIDDLSIKNPYITIAGQTAPGDGILITQDPSIASFGSPLMKTSTHDIVIRYLRMRIGPYGKDVDNDNLVIEDGSYDVVVDHNSFSWAVDENLSTYGQDGAGAAAAHNVTISWNIISEALDRSTHPEGAHSKGLLTKRSYNLSIHHNLFAHNYARNPKITINSDLGIADVVNNVAYNFGTRSTEGPLEVDPDFASKGRVNVVGNYIIPGINTECLSSTSACYYVSGTHGIVYLDNNHFEGKTALTQWNLIVDQRFPPEQAWFRFDAPYITTHSASEAYQLVLSKAGATLPQRDITDRRIVNEVKNKSGSIKDCVLSSDPTTVSNFSCSSSDARIVPEGWATYESGTPPTDNDNDGMPDSWEQTHGGNIDPSGVAPSGYTWIEEYINGLAAGDPTTTTPTPSPSPTPKPGDANEDDTVDESDFSIWLESFLNNTFLGDFNSDLSTDGIDYVIWLTNYGK